MTKTKYKINWEDCKKEGLCTLETMTIDGKKYNNIKVYHFEVCQGCQKDCRGKPQYKAKIGALEALSKLVK